VVFGLSEEEMIDEDGSDNECAETGTFNFWLRQKNNG